MRSLVMWVFIVAWGGMLAWAVLTYGRDWGLDIPAKIPAPADIVRQIFR